MITTFLLGTLLMITTSLTLPPSHFAPKTSKQSQQQQKLAVIKKHMHDKKSVEFKYTGKVASSSYRTDEIPSPRIMKYLPLTEKEGKIAPLFSNIQAVQKYYIQEVGSQKIVDMDQAKKLSNLLESTQGQGILTYFQGLAEGNLNFYHLSPQNYHLWLAIKIVANKDIKKYARSVAQNLNLFTEFYHKARQMKIKQIIGIPSPSKKLLKNLDKPVKNMPSIRSQYSQKSHKKQQKQQNKPKKQVNPPKPKPTKKKEDNFNFFPGVTVRPSVKS